MKSASIPWRINWVMSILLIHKYTRISSKVSYTKRGYSGRCFIPLHSILFLLFSSCLLLHPFDLPMLDWVPSSLLPFSAFWTFFPFTSAQLSSFFFFPSSQCVCLFVSSNWSRQISRLVERRSRRFPLRNQIPPLFPLFPLSELHLHLTIRACHSKAQNNSSSRWKGFSELFGVDSPVPISMNNLFVEVGKGSNAHVKQAFFHRHPEHLKPLGLYQEL